MNRRKFVLSTVAGAGLLSGHRVLAQVRTVNRVIVVGAGIVGACIAYQLAKRGCEVTVIDKGLPASQASGNTFAWINAAYTNRPAAYLDLRLRALDAYRELSQAIEFPIRWGGSLEWFEERERERGLVREVAQFSETPGTSTKMVPAETAADIEPHLRLSGSPQLAYSNNDGAVDAPAATQAIFDAALAHGARAVLLAEVTSIRQRRRDVRVRTEVGNFEADLVVIAAGVGSQRLASMVDERVDSATRATPGVIVTTEPRPLILNTVLYPPRVHIHQLADGRFVIGEKAGAPDTPDHGRALRDRPNAFPDSDQATRHALRVLSLAREYLPDLAEVRELDVGIGWRPMPGDGLPIIGRGPNAPYAYFATMHSGVTLAPIVGELVAGEILDQQRSPLLDPFRPERFSV